MLLCASGTPRPPRGAKLDRLLARIAARDAFVATLAGARIGCDGATLRISRDVGEFARRGRREVDLADGQTIAFDGRFEVTAREAGLRLTPLAGRACALEKAEQPALKAISPEARGALPTAIGPAGAATCGLVGGGRIVVRSLITPRLAGALGVINCESAISRVAKSTGTS